MNVTNLQLVLACATVLALLGALLWALVRVRTFNTLQAEHQALRQREQELISAIRASGGGQWEWDVRIRQLSFLGHFYAQGSSADSFDSRYRSSGLVRIDQVLGVARPIF